VLNVQVGGSKNETNKKQWKSRTCTVTLQWKETLLSETDKPEIINDQPGPEFGGAYTLP